MKYKVLLTGKNNTIIDDFFIQMEEKFETLTTSGRYEDILNHLKYFEPDIFVYCLSHEANETLSKANFVNELSRMNVPLAIIGSEEDCSHFTEYAFYTVDLVLTKPITANAIMNRIVEYLEEKERKQMEAVRAEEERIEKEKAARRKHILIVDDDPGMLKMIREYLHEQYDVATALSGKIALKFLEKKTTDLILLDYEMPVQSGPDVLEKLRENDNTKDIPVVFLTGITERDKIQKALVLKPQGYLLKPIDFDKLTETILTLIS
jgi:CheY-like chemotaxis protein